jgi:hypothetical protein
MARRYHGAWAGHHAYAYGGYAAKDGFSAVLGWKEKDEELTFLRKPAKEPLERAKIKPAFRVGNFYYSAQILWDQVMLRGVTKDNERRLFAQPVLRAGDPIGAPVDVGELPEPGLIEGGQTSRRTSPAARRPRRRWCGSRATITTS